MRDDIIAPNTKSLFSPQDDTRVYERERERERVGATGFFITTIISYPWEICSPLGRNF